MQKLLQLFYLSESAGNNDLEEKIYGHTEL